MAGKRSSEAERELPVAVGKDSMPILMPVKSHFFVKWLHAGHYQAAADIECNSCERFWTLKHIKKHMYSRGGHGKVIANMKTPVGYIAYHARRDERLINVRNLVILPEYRRQKLASLLIDELLKKTEWYDRITMCVRESNYPAHKFLAACRFKAVGVKRDYFQDEFPEGVETEDGYFFERWVKA